MEVNAKAVGKTALKVAGAACVGTGLVLAGAVIASGAAVGSLAEGFVMAKKAVVDIFKKEDTAAEDVVAAKTQEVVDVEAVVTKTQEVVYVEAVVTETQETVAEDTVSEIEAECVTGESDNSKKEAEV